MYEDVKRRLRKVSPNNAFLDTIVASCVAGAVSSGVFTPTDLIKVRMQSGDYQYRGLWHAASTILREESARALWKGAVTTMGRAVTVTLLNLPPYDWCKEVSQWNADIVWITQHRC